MSGFTVKRATRQGVKPLIGLYSESGCGKTYSSLLLARGLVGPSGKLVMIDTESGRGSLYADVINGGYEIIDLHEPFSPGRYVEALQAAEHAGAQCVIIDSASHEWEGLGGVLDMAHAIEEKSGKPGLHCWKTPKLEHNKMMLALLQSPLPVIVNLRAHFKSRQGKNERTGKTEILKDEFTTPIQSEAFIYEMTVHGEIMQDHSFRLTKCSHPALRACFPAGKPISIETGVAVAAWCNAVPVGAVDPKLLALFGELRGALAVVIGKGKDANERLEGWLKDRSIIAESDTLKTALTVATLPGIIEKVKINLAEMKEAGTLL